MLKAYMDSNVLAYRFLSADSSKSLSARRIFKKCKDGTHLGVISTLTLIEFSGVCQKTATYHQKIESVPEKSREKFILEEGLKLFNTSVSSILSMPYVQIIEMKNLDLQKVLCDALKIMNETVGIVSIQKTRGPHKFKFERAYTADLLHVLLAKHLKCDEFYTFDQGIKKLEGHPNIESLQIMLSRF